MTESETSRKDHPVWAVVPVKGPGVSSKQRLAPLLDSDARRALSRAMLEDVLEALAQVESLDGILLVSGDRALKELESCYPRLRFYPEPPEVTGLNGAVTVAAEFLAAQGVQTVLVLHGDLPLLTATELTRLLACHGRVAGPHATLVPDDQADGTNALAVTPPLALSFAYGRASFERHWQLAVERGLPVTVFPSEVLALDIDTPEDIRLLAALYDQDPALRMRRSCRLLARLEMQPDSSHPEAMTLTR